MGKEMPGYWRNAPKFKRLRIEILGHYWKTLRESIAHWGLYISLCDLVPVHFSGNQIPHFGSIFA